MKKHKAKWPTMKPIRVRSRMEPEMMVDATVDMDGRCLVTVHHDNSFMDDAMLFPDEARRYARALMKAAAVAAAKKAMGKRMVRENTR